MERRFETFFSIKICKGDGSTITPYNAVLLTPTADCQRQLSRHGMLFKGTDTGGLIIMGKTVKSGIITGEPLHPFAGLVDFTFQLKLQSSEILNQIEPFANSKFSSDLSNSFLLYFDNLDQDLKPDKSTDLTNVDTGTSPSDIYFQYPNALQISTTKTNKMRVLPLRPGGVAKDFVPSSTENKFIKIEFGNGAFQVDWTENGQNKQEKVLVSPDLGRASPHAIIRIFKDKNTDYNTQKNYRIILKKKE
jgi:hypothetical protein